MLKQLQGTEKQVKWAEGIRVELIEKFEKLESADVSTYLELNSKLSPNPTLSLAQTSAIVTREKVTKIKEYILENKTEAKWYIEEGRNLITPIIQKVYFGMLREEGKQIEILYPEWVPEIKELLK